MGKQSNNLEQIRDTFAILHDGWIAGFTGDLSELRLKVDCEYLAERIDKTYTSFYIHCRKVEKLELHCWMNPVSVPVKTLFEPDDIFKADLEFIAAKIEDGVVKVDCYQHNTSLDYCGGTLILDCDSIKIFDHENNILTIDQLAAIARGYWKDFSDKVEQTIINRNQSGNDNLSNYR